MNRILKVFATEAEQERLAEMLNVIERCPRTSRACLDRTLLSYRAAKDGHGLSRPRRSRLHTIAPQRHSVSVGDLTMAVSRRFGLDAFNVRAVPDKVKSVESGLVAAPVRPCLRSASFWRWRWIWEACDGERPIGRTRAMSTTGSTGGRGPTAVGGRLRSRRLQLGLSQRAMSGSGISYAYISRIEAGSRQPSLKALRMLAAKLDVSVEWLETGEDRQAEALSDLVEGLAKLRRAIKARTSDRPAWREFEDAAERLGHPLPWRRTKSKT
jgi:transcriptional regulator with XRE-family HTH domain